MLDRGWLLKPDIRVDGARTLYKRRLREIIVLSIKTRNDNEVPHRKWPLLEYSLQWITSPFLDYQWLTCELCYLQLACALVCVAAAAQLPSRGVYRPAVAVSASANSGRYVEGAGKYVPDNSGKYVHTDNPYKHV